MTYTEGRELAGKIRDGLPMYMRQQLKAIHIHPTLHNGHCTIRIFMTPVTADDPEPYIFANEEL